MSGQVYLNLSAIFYSILIAFCFFCKKRVKSKETVSYGILIWVSIFELLCGLASTLVVELKFDSSIVVFVSKLFFCSILSWIYVFTGYLINVSAQFKSDNSTKEENTENILLNVFFIISCVIIFFTRLSINYVDGLIYTSGFSLYYLFFSAFSMVIFCFFLGIRNFKNYDKRFIPLWLFIIFGCIFSIIQFFHPEIFLIVPLEVFITSVMYHTIENPDVKMIEQLQVARDQADKANQSKTEFLSSMSHEIRTPLNAIVGFSDCIMDANTLDEAKENAKDIVSASDTLLEIVNGILDISKIEAGKLEIVNSKYNANEVFTELAKLITPRMKDKGLDFTYHIDPTLPKMLYGDHASIKKIVTNLLSNACKYTSHGFVHYDVSCVRMGEFVKLIISVEDSGRGIKKDSIDKMFTKFQRLDEDRNTTIEGTGLGLAITKQLAEMMGGKIICHTVYGEGSKFTAVINQRIENDDNITENKVEVDSVDLSGLRILVVDDTPLNIKVAVKLLQRYKANVIDSCNSGFECINKVKSGNKYDLILLDDMMPKLSGTETLAKLKEIPGFNTFTVALTANALTGMREKYIKNGFDDYLSKPIEVSELIRISNKLLVNDFEDYSVTNRVEMTEEEKKEKDKVIPVEDNIEEILGSQLDLSDRSSKTEVLEHLDVDDKTEVLEVLDEPEIISTVDVIPVADLNNSAHPVYDRKYLEDNGCDFNHALELLGDVSMYNSTIEDFLEEIDDKWKRIVEYKNSGDMENYSIDVHSLKSDCKYLGFMKLADIAYQHELKSKDKDISFVNSNFNELEDEYNRVVKVIRNYHSQNISS